MNFTSLANFPIADTKELSKQTFRLKVWNYLTENGIATFPLPVKNRIPNFLGADKAGRKIDSLPEFTSAQTVKINPDKPQEEIRFITLQKQKKLLVPTPRLREGLFNLLEYEKGDNAKTLRKKVTSEGVKHLSKPKSLEDKIKVDLIVIGCVAVSTTGRRIGKGEGYADLEYAMMKTMKSIDDSTPIVTTVHDCQVFDELPSRLFQDYDVPIDIIITPTQVIEVKEKLKRPLGMYWHLLSKEKFLEIPILRKLYEIDQKNGLDVSLLGGFQPPSQPEVDEFRKDRESLIQEGKFPSRVKKNMSSQSENSVNTPLNYCEGNDGNSREENDNNSSEGNDKNSFVEKDSDSAFCDNSNKKGKQKKKKLGKLQNQKGDSRGNDENSKENESEKKQNPQNVKLSKSARNSDWSEETEESNWELVEQSDGTSLGVNSDGKDKSVEKPSKKKKQRTKNTNVESSSVQVNDGDSRKNEGARMESNAKAGEAAVQWTEVSEESGWDELCPDSSNKGWDGGDAECDWVSAPKEERSRGRGVSKGFDGRGRGDSESSRGIEDWRGRGWSDRDGNKGESEGWRGRGGSERGRGRGGSEGWRGRGGSERGRGRGGSEWRNSEGSERGRGGSEGWRGRGDSQGWRGRGDSQGWRGRSGSERGRGRGRSDWGRNSEEWGGGEGSERGRGRGRSDWGRNSEEWGGREGSERGRGRGRSDWGRNSEEWGGGERSERGRGRGRSDWGRNSEEWGGGEGSERGRGRGRSDWGRNSEELGGGEGSERGRGRGRSDWGRNSEEWGGRERSERGRGRGRSDWGRNSEELGGRGESQGWRDRGGSEEWGGRGGSERGRGRGRLEWRRGRGGSDRGRNSDERGGSERSPGTESPEWNGGKALLEGWRGRKARQIQGLNSPGQEEEQLGGGLNNFKNIQVTFNISKQNTIVRREVEETSLPDRIGSTNGMDDDSSVPFAVYVGGIPYNSNVSELHEVLKDRGVKPSWVSWKGEKGYAFLNFKEESCSRPDEVINSLQGLSIGQRNLRVSLKEDNRQEPKVLSDNTSRSYYNSYEKPSRGSFTRHASDSHRPLRLPHAEKTEQTPSHSDNSWGKTDDNSWGELDTHSSW